MIRVLFVAADLAYGSATRQLQLLQEGLPRDEFEVRVCVLSGGAGWLDARPLLRLRRVLSDWRADMIHTWGPWGLRAAVLAAGKLPRPLVVSHLLRPSRRGGALEWLDRRLAARADRVVAGGESEARCLGLSDEKVAIIPPGVTCPAAAGHPSATGERIILCVGPLEPHKGFRDAIWAFDVLRRTYPDLQMRIVGSGRDRPNLERFTASISLEHCVRFVGEQAEIGGFLNQASAVWVPSRANAGVTVALEAMAAGRPVLASRQPALAEVIADGETGLLTEPGNKIALAKQTWHLLDEPAWARELGEAGRRSVSRSFSAGAMVQRFADLYHEVRAREAQGRQPLGLGELHVSARG